VRFEVATLVHVPMRDMVVLILRLEVVLRIKVISLEMVVVRLSVENVIL